MSDQVTDTAMQPARKTLRQALDAQWKQANAVAGVHALLQPGAPPDAHRALTFTFDVLDVVSLAVLMVAKDAQLDELTRELFVTGEELRRWYGDNAGPEMVQRLLERHRRIYQRLDHLDGGEKNV